MSYIKQAQQNEINAKKAQVLDDEMRRVDTLREVERRLAERTPQIREAVMSAFIQGQQSNALPSSLDSTPPLPTSTYKGY